MGIDRKRAVALLLAASALAAPTMAAAKGGGTDTAALVARLERMEAEIAQLKTDLAAARGQQADTAIAVRQATAQAQQAVAQSQQAATRVAAVEAKPAPEGMRSGPTTIKLGGYLKLIAANTRFGDGAVATNSLGRDFYLPQAIPTGGAPSRYQDFTAKQTRLWLNLATDVAGHSLKGYLETDFQTTANAAPAIAGGGSQRTTNGYTLALRRAYLQLDRWTIGQDWTTFQNPAVLPESTDYVGGAEGTVFVRQPLIRYSAPLAKSVTLHVAAENPESGTASLGAPAVVENGTDHLPDFAARLAWAGKPGELSLAAVTRQVRVATATSVVSRGGWGVSGSGKLWLNAARTADARVMLTYGQGIGRYVGLNFAPDGVIVPASGRLEDVGVFAALGAVRVPLTPTLRVNLMGSYQSVDYADVLPRTGALNIAGFNKSAWSGAANLFYTPVKGVDVGIEYRHGERELVSGATGVVDRFEFAAKYGF